MPIDILIVSTLAALLQVAALMLLIRGVMWLLGLRVRMSIVYGIFTAGSMPFMRLTRRIMPPGVPDLYIPAIAFVLVIAACAAVVLAQQSLCVHRGAQCG